MKKKAIAWDVIGKWIVILLFLVVALIILGLVMGKSTELVQKIKSFF